MSLATWAERKAVRVAPAITAGPPAGVTVTRITETILACSWDTDEDTRAGIVYRPASSPGEQRWPPYWMRGDGWTALPTRTHDLAITDLEPDTEYVITLEALRASGAVARLGPFRARTGPVPTEYPPNDVRQGRGISQTGSYQDADVAAYPWIRIYPLEVNWVDTQPTRGRPLNFTPYETKIALFAPNGKWMRPQLEAGTNPSPTWAKAGCELRQNKTWGDKGGGSSGFVNSGFAGYDGAKLNDLDLSTPGLDPAGSAVGSRIILDLGSSSGNWLTMNMVMVATEGGVGQMPATFAVQWSTDAVTWTTVATVGPGSGRLLASWPSTITRRYWALEMMVKGAGVQRVTEILWLNQTDSPLRWDPEHTARYWMALKQLGNRYDARTDLLYCNIQGIGDSGEMNMPTPVKNGHRLWGYTDQDIATGMRWIWRQALHFLHRVWPHQRIALVPGSMSVTLDGKAVQLQDEIIADAVLRYGTRLNLVHSGAHYDSTGLILQKQQQYASQCWIGGLITVPSDRRLGTPGGDPALRPVSDVSVGGWINTPLYDKINETTRNDGNFIRSSQNPVNDTCIVALTSVIDPQNNTGHTLSFSYLVDTAGGLIDLMVELVDVQTLQVFATIVISPLPEVAAQTDYTLTAQEADAIPAVSYGRLGIRITANKTGGPNCRAKFTWAKLPLTAEPVGDVNATIDVICRPTVSPQGWEWMSCGRNDMGLGGSWTEDQKTAVKNYLAGIEPNFRSVEPY